MTYKSAAVLCYDGSRKGTCCLKHLSQIDQEYELTIKSNGLLQSLFTEVVGNSDGDGSVNETSATDEAKQMGLLMLEHCFINRARLACQQKVELAEAGKGIIDGDSLANAVTFVHRELDYAILLLDKLDKPRSKEWARVVENCRKCPLELCKNFNDRTEQKTNCLHIVS